MNHRIRSRWLVPIACISASLTPIAPAADDFFVNQVGVLVEYYELDQSSLPPLLREYQQAPDASGLLTKVQKLAKANRRLVESSYLVTSDAQRAKISSIREYLYPTEFDPPELPQTLHGLIAGDIDIITATNPTAYDVRNLGHELEFEPKISADGSFVNLAIAPTRVQLIGETRWGEDVAMTAQPLFHAMNSSSKIAVKFGGCELFGTFAVPGSDGRSLLGFVCPTNLSASEKEFVLGKGGDQADNAKKRPEQISLITEYIEVGAAQASQIAREIRNSADATKIRLRLDEAISKGEAKLIHSNTALSRAGERTSSGSVDEYIYPTEYDPAEIAQTLTGPIDPELDWMTSVGATAFDVRLLGFTVQFEPKLGAGASLIHLKIAPQHVRHVGEVTNGIDESRARQPLFETITLATAVGLADGTSMLIGMHGLETARANETADEKEKAAVRDRRVLVFVTGKIKSLGGKK